MMQKSIKFHKNSKQMNGEGRGNYEIINKKYQMPLVCLILLLISSCATVTEKHINSVSFITKDMEAGKQIEGAKCEIVKNNKVISS